MFGFESEGMEHYKTFVGNESQTVTCMLTRDRELCNKILSSIIAYDDGEISRCLTTTVSQKELYNCITTALMMHSQVTMLMRIVSITDQCLHVTHSEKGQLIENLNQLYNHLINRLKALDQKFRGDDAN